MGTKFEKMPKADFLKRATNPTNLGGLIDCSHIIGSSQYEKLSDNEALGHHQIYVRYVRWTDDEKKTVEVASEGLIIMTHSYEKFDGGWKLVGTCPQPRLGDLNAGKIFK
jgi:scytalone dehydratase